MKTLGTALEAMNTTNTNGVKMSGYTEEEEWLDDIFVRKLDFEDNKIYNKYYKLWTIVS